MITKTYITRTLFDIYDTQDKFINDLEERISTTFIEDESKRLFRLIFGKYGDSNIRYTNEELFKINLFNEIEIHYPTVLATLRDQKLFQEDLNDTFKEAGKMIANTASHNTSTTISNDTSEGLSQLDNQAITKTYRGTLPTLIDKTNAYRSGIENSFLDKLNKLFIQIILPQRDLLYITGKEEE